MYLGGQGNLLVELRQKVKQARYNTSNCTRRTDKDGEATCEYVGLMPKAAEKKGEEKW